MQSENDEGVLYLPRNLSYVQESNLDNYSVSSRFVYNPRSEGRFRQQEIIDICSAMADQAVGADGETLDVQNGTASADREPATGDCNPQSEIDLPECDTESEEGFFVNMMDDLDSFEGTLNGKSLESNDLAVDSVSSRNEAEFDLPSSHEGHTLSVEEPVKSIAAADMNAKPELQIKINDKPLLDSRTEQAFLNFVSSDSPLYEDREFNFTKAELRKSSSLKTNKTPPGTPSRKKVVRFADALGLDLESVRNIVNLDTPPKIPPSAMADLKVGLEEDRREMGSRYLTACFAQPGAADNFITRILAEKVCLENAVITDVTITGVVRVANIGFHKVVRVRFSTNKWQTFHDIAASYVHNSCDGPTDRFSFSIVAPANFGVGSTLEFAVSYTVGDSVYWDNNQGKNYVFECFAKTIPTETENSWMHFL